ncbi:hypothetical protein [Blattabacterium cuenoti]|uniref:hypothetical protein n=1 Tax=Blattabacterium cuenoti TaxID=1653831 RepID=UPI00163C7055|nr:hypothetical protein [Blattabacterium cuenoti]
MKKSTKIILFILILIGSIYAFFYKKNLCGIILFLISLFPIFFIFRNEFLLLAFFKIKKKNIKGLKKCLKSIKNPKLQLTKNQIAYYYFLYGIVYSESNIIKSENYMQKALYLGLKFKQNIAIAQLNLAIASLSKGHKKKAEFLLLEAKKKDIHGLLHDQIKIIKNKMKNIGYKNRPNPYFRNKY